MFAGLAAERYDRQYADRELVRRLAAYFAPHRGRLIALGVALTVITAAGLLMPLLLSRGLDQVVHAPTREGALLLSAAVLALMVVNWIGSRVRRRMVARLVADVVGQMRLDAFNATLRHDLAFFDEFQSGKVIARITNDTQELSQVAALITELFSQLLVVIALVIVLFTISVPLTLVLLVIAPLAPLAGWGLRQLARRVTRVGFRAIAEVNAAIQEAVAGIRVAKNFRQERSIYARFSAINQRSYAVNLRRGFVLANVFPVLNTLSGFGTALMTYAGALAVFNGSVSLGAWYLFILSLEQLWFPLTNIASFWSQIQNALSACERIFALMDAPANVHQQPVAQNGKHGLVQLRLKGEIRFERVRFRYNAQQQVLDDFSLHIRPGESVALVGHTGAGKSSIIKLVMRFYEFQAGRILIDGHDIRTLDLEHYRRQIGLVSQVPFLFNDTVLNNIRYARPELSEAEVARIAERIGDGEWLASLPNGLHTVVGERGQRLSMGQRQLVALARVLAQQPAIFILDEATASVDPFTERQIQAALNLILAQSTAILIAHRLSTVQAADRIIVLERGRIVEEGNHETLMARGGHYAQLYDAYFRHQSADFNAEVFRRMKTGA